MGALEEGGKVASGTVDALKSTPLAIALLVVNVAFLGVVTFVLSTIATNASARDKAQTELISKLATECRPSPGGTL